VFGQIAKEEPDLFIWLGDVAYLDNDYLVYSTHLTPEYTFNSTKDTENYRKLQETTEIIGVWDDHDYGINNGGKEFARKDYIRELWLDFIDEPRDSERRIQVGSPIH
jgi:alkaline phosphatase D